MRNRDNDLKGIQLLIMGANFGAVLKHYRTERKLSLRALAKETGISASYINFLENGDYDNPSIDVVKKLAVALEVNPDLFLTSAGLVDPEVNEAMKRNPEGISEALRKSGSYDLVSTLGSAFLFLVCNLLLEDAKSGGSETPDEIHKALRELLKNENIEPAEERQVFDKIKAVMKLWEMDLKGREDGE